MGFQRERVAAFPDLSASRLTREIREMGYAGAYTAVKRYLAAIRPEPDPKPYEVRFETKAGVQGQVDCARFVVEFTDEPGVARIVWLFSLVLGYSRFLFAHYVLHQDLQTLLRCHMQAFEALDGVPIEILYDRMGMPTAQHSPRSLNACRNDAERPYPASASTQPKRSPAATTRSISSMASSGFVLGCRMSSGTPALIIRASSLVQLSDRYSRGLSMSGTSPDASVTDTSVWQLAFLPRAEAY